MLAREEERRRLRRDLHDGLGPALAGHLLRLDVVAAAGARLDSAAADMTRLRDDLRATVIEVRRVVEGCGRRPSTSSGLAGALDQAAQRLSAGTSLRHRRRGAGAAGAARGGRGGGLPGDDRGRDERRAALRRNVVRGERRR